MQKLASTQFFRAPKQPRMEGFIPRFKNNLKGVDFLTAFERARAENKKIPCLKSAAEMLYVFEKLDNFEQLLPFIGCWTSTIVGYAEPGATFRNSKLFSPDSNSLVFYDRQINRNIVLPIGHFGGLVNSALVLEYPYAIVKEGKDIRFEGALLDSVAEFPLGRDRHVPDLVHGVPCGKPVKPESKGISYIVSRAEGRGWIGPASVDVFLDTVAVSLNNSFSSDFGVIVESAAPQVQKKAGIPSISGCMGGGPMLEAAMA